MEEENIETAIQALKDAGATQVECVKVVMSELHKPLREADALVLNSKAWSEQKNVTLELRTLFEKALDEYPSV